MIMTILNTQELKTLLDESGDLIPKQYRGMLSSILGMEELVVEDIMTPTSEIIGLDIKYSYESNKKLLSLLNIPDFQFLRALLIMNLVLFI